jgi:hypothetical protein
MFYLIHFQSRTNDGMPLTGDLAQMVERSLSMREALGSMPRFSICVSISVLLCFGVCVYVCLRVC